MWILANSEDLLCYLQARSVTEVSTFKNIEYATLYTTLLDDKLNPRLIAPKAFNFKNDNSYKTIFYVTIPYIYQYTTKRRSLQYRAPGK